jgi:cell wall-associated NlpC family hydrolase
MGNSSSEPLPVCRPEDPLPSLEEFTYLLREAWVARQAEANRKALEREAEQKRISASIVAHARQQVGSVDWAYEVSKGPYPADTNKCNLFVYDVLTSAGLPVPLKEHYGWFNRTTLYPPLAGQWADPSVDIPGWVVVTSPQPGDVAAMKEDYSDASGHVAIVSGPNLTVSMSSDADMVVENDWGFRPEQQGDVVFRHYVGAPK